MSGTTVTITSLHEFDKMAAVEFVFRAVAWKPARPPDPIFNV